MEIRILPWGPNFKNEREWKMAVIIQSIFEDESCVAIYEIEKIHISDPKQKRCYDAILKAMEHPLKEINSPESFEIDLGAIESAKINPPCDVRIDDIITLYCIN